MCESSAWLHRDEDDEELLLEDVIMLRPREGRIELTSILGEKRTVDADLDRVDLLNHRILLRPRG